MTKNDEHARRTTHIPRLGLLGHMTVVSVALTASTYLFGYHKVAEALLVWSAFVGVFAVLTHWQSNRGMGDSDAE